jgi:hypothetical protein
MLRAIPVVVFLAALALARAAGFAMQIPDGLVQLLDTDALAEHPVASLCYLHTQPPGLNLLLVLVLAVARILATPPTAVAGALFVAIGLAAAIVLWRLLLGLTGSRILSTLGLIAALADPGYPIYEHIFFYEFLLHAGLVFVLAAAAGYLARGGRGRLYALVALLAAIVLTRSLYHPIWACGVLILTVWLRVRREEHPAQGLREGALAMVSLVAVLSVWPIKNWIVFGAPFYCTTTAYNVARHVPGCPSIVTSPMLFGPTESPDVAAIVSRAARICGPDGSDVLVTATKPDGSPNWNHAMLLLVAPLRVRCGIAWRRDHPLDWLARAAGFYCMWARPTFVHPYSSDEIVGSPDERYRRYARAYADVLFHDLRPAIERHTPGWFLHDQAMIRGQPVPYTVAGFVVFPSIALATVFLLASRRWQLFESVATVALLCWLWPMLAACLSDGWEGNRMRFSTGPAFLVMACYVITAVLHRRRSDGTPGAGRR